MATLEKRVTGFQTAGIYPLDSNKFNTDAFAPARHVKELVVTHDNIKEKINAPADNQSSTEGRNFLDLQSSTSTIGRNPVNLLDTTSTSTSQFKPKISVQKISPVPTLVMSEQLRKGNTKNQHSEIFTSSSIQASFEIAKKKKQASFNIKEETNF